MTNKYIIDDVRGLADGGTRYTLSTDSEDDPALTVHENADFEVVKIMYTACELEVSEEHQRAARACIEDYYKAHYAEG